MGSPPAGQSHWIRPSTRRRRQCGGLTWLTRHICGQKAGGACSPLMRRGVFSVNFALWGAPREEFLDMCDYSLHSVRTRSAKVGEKLVTYNFGTGTRGFAAPEDCSVAVCLLPGTELALEFPDGEIVLLTRLCEGQKATVLTLPTQAKTDNQEEAQQRVAPVG